MSLNKKFVKILFPAGNLSSKIKFQPKGNRLFIYKQQNFTLFNFFFKIISAPAYYLRILLVISRGSLCVNILTLFNRTTNFYYSSN